MNDSRLHPWLNESLEELLQRGGQFLSENRLSEARSVFEHANQLEPLDERCLNLLGLTYFRLRLDRQAAEIYRQLVTSKPNDATLRMNLGLVYLRLEQFTLAIGEFEAALSVDFSLNKAHHYIGKAHAQLGNYGLAQEHYLKAGESALAEKMLQAQVQTALPAVSDAGSTSNESQDVIMSFEEPVPTMPAFIPARVPLVETNLSQAEATDNSSEFEIDEGDVIELTKVVRTSHDMSSPNESFHTPRKSVSPPRVAESPSWVPTSALAQLATGALVSEGLSDGVFSVSPTHCVLSINGMLHARLEGWVAIQGKVRPEPLRKMYKGKLVSETFGDGTLVMQKLFGEGKVVLDALGRTFKSLSLSDETAFFKERAVAAFAGSVIYENGRMAGSHEGELLDLVGLSGPGQVLVEVDGELSSLEVKPQAAVTVALRQLIGWLGDLRPKLVSPSGPALELSGTGYVLLGLPNPSTR